MARELIIRITDDLDRSLEADETIMLGFQGTWYELDLTRKHLTELEAALGPYLKAARKADPDEPPLPPVVPGQHMGARKYKAAARAWGEKNGWPGALSMAGGYHPRAMLEAFDRHLRERAAGL